MTDSPWFWAMLFCAGGAFFLFVISPKYAKRQGRLELQYQAHQEKARRQVVGEPAAREIDQEGTAAPPAEGDLIIPLWPLGLICLVLFGVSAALFRRARLEQMRPNPSHGNPKTTPRAEP